MRQSRFRWLGLLEFVIAGALVAAFGPRMLAAEPAALLFFASAAGVTMCCLGFLGIDIARDGRHFDVTGDVDRVRSL